MSKTRFFMILFFGFSCTTHSTLNQEDVFERFWHKSKKIAYDKKRVSEFWTEENYRYLKKKSAKAADIYELQKLLNEFLGKVNISHTHFYTDQDLDFYFFRSLFTTHDIKKPKLRHIGIQLEKIDDDYFVREVLNGYPAQRAGIKRGDQILTCDEISYSPIRCFEGINKAVRLKVRRNGKSRVLSLKPVYESLHESFLQAMVNSLKIENVKGKKVGYLRLWAGTNNKILKKYKALIKESLLDIDGLILDLRGGFGGAWYDYLDPFFKNRNDFFVSTWIDREGKQTINKPSPKNFDWYFSGPMIVLLNEGVRSGKESLAFQFKKSKRATLVGGKTKGAFTAGYAIFKELNLDYFLYLASAEVLLDGQTIEGIGVSPDVRVHYPIKNAPDRDPQLKKARELMAEKL